MNLVVENPCSGNEYLESLPKELLPELFKHLSLKDASAFSQTCKNINEVFWQFLGETWKINPDAQNKKKKIQKRYDVIKQIVYLKDFNKNSSRQSEADRVYNTEGTFPWLRTIGDNFLNPIETFAPKSFSIPSLHNLYSEFKEFSLKNFTFSVICWFRGEYDGQGYWDRCEEDPLELWEDVNFQKKCRETKLLRITDDSLIIPSQIRFFENLRTLHLGQSFMGESLRAHELGVLMWTHKLPIELSSEVWALPNLEELTIKGSGLKHLSKKVGQLSQLKIVDVRENLLKTLPKEIWSLKKLVEVRVPGFFNRFKLFALYSELHRNKINSSILKPF